MTSKLIVNNIEADAGVSTITFGSEISASKITTSSTSAFSSGLNVTGVSTFTGDIISGSSGFFYDYSTGRLGVGIDPPGSARLHVKGHSSLNNSLLVDVNTGDSTLGFAENGTEKWRIENVTSADALRFYDVTNTAERFRIDSSGRTGIGTIPSNFGNNANSLELHSPNSTQTFLTLTNTTTGSNGVTNGLNLAMIGTSARFLNRENGEIQFQINGTERLRILAAGGLTFNGDTAAANALDDYEEGTWTPTVTFSGGGSVTYLTQSGNYTKIGNIVRAYFYIQINAATSPSGEFRFSLPFTVSDRAAFVVYTEFVSSLTGPVFATAMESQTYARGYMNTGGTHANWPSSSLGFGSEIRASFVYRV